MLVRKLDQGHQVLVRGQGLRFTARSQVLISSRPVRSYSAGPVFSLRGRTITRLPDLRSRLGTCAYLAA